MTIDELLQSRPWFTRDIHLPDAPVGMLGHREAQLYYHLAKEAFHGLGTVVDAGSFLGKSAYFLAQGLRANSRYLPARHRIHCFDNFLVNEDGTVRFIRDHLNRAKAVGDSTREIFEAQVSPVRDVLEIHAGDFHAVTWPRQPIEILMVDIAKTESLLKRVVEMFFPELIPGKSLVIHQDYHHPWLPYIHVTMEYLAEYFELVAPRVDDSAVFRYRSAIPENILQCAKNYDFSHEEQLQLIDGAISRLAEGDRYYVQLARVVLQFRRTHEAALRGELDELHQRFQKTARDYSTNPYFDDVRHSLDELEGWRCHGEGNYERCLHLASQVAARRRTSYNVTMIGCALNGLARYREAEEQLRAALDLHPRAGYAYIELAQALAGQERFTDAETALLRGLRDNSTEPVPSQDYLDMFSYIWRRENSPENKIRVMAELHRALPDDPEVWVLEARLREMAGNPAGAGDSLSVAAQLGLSPERLGQVRNSMQLTR
jgi:tetratricopeptide (TPR) repeat protein